MQKKDARLFLTGICNKNREMLLGLICLALVTGVFTAFSSAAHAEEAALQYFFSDAAAADVRITEAEGKLTEKRWLEVSGGIAGMFSDELNEQLNARNQQLPEYAASFDQCTDNNLLYILPDGCVYKSQERMSGEIRNELLFATDADGAEFNGGMGYADDMRYSTTSSSDENTEGWDVSGYIPAQPGDTIYLQDVDFFDLSNSSSRARFVFFDHSYNYITCSDFFDNFQDIPESWRPAEDENRQLKQCTIPESYTSEIEFVRLSVKDMRPSSIVTVNNPIEGFEPVSLWHSVEKIAIEISDETEEEQPSAADALPEPGIPDYWTEHLDTKVDEIRRRMEEAGRNKSAFLWYTDSHWNRNSGMSPLLLNYLYRNTPINKTIFGGDIVYVEPTPETKDDHSIMAYLWEWREAIRDLPHHHSVVGNHDDGNTTNNIFSSDYVYAYLMAPEECSDIVRGGDFHYHIDDPNERTRYLYLNTAFGSILYSEEQQLWLEEVLKTTPENWHIVAIAHIWIDVDYDQEPAVVEGLSENGAYLLDIFDDYNMRRGKYADAKAKVEFCIGGHTHIDAVYISESGIPVITTETDSLNVRSDLPDDLGTINESSVNAVIADYDTNTIYIERIGRGEDMIINY